MNVGQRWNRPNVRPPAWLPALEAKPPACFTPPQWRIYLTGVVQDAMTSKPLRARLDRGAAPSYCEECTPAHKAQMQAAGRCHPPEEPTCK